MPIYEYTCTACGAQSEILQKLSDPPAKKCPVCGKSRLTKQISAAGFRLAGGGWYETDFKKDGKKNLAGDQPEAAPAAAGADGKKADGPAAKPDKSDAAAKPAKADSGEKKKSDGKSDKKKPAKAA